MIFQVENSMKSLRKRTIAFVQVVVMPGRVANLHT